MELKIQVQGLFMSLFDVFDVVVVDEDGSETEISKRQKETSRDGRHKMKTLEVARECKSGIQVIAATTNDRLQKTTFLSALTSAWIVIDGNMVNIDRIFNVGREFFIEPTSFQH